MIRSSEGKPSEAVGILLHRLNAKFTRHSIEKLEQHPEYPSLLSINDTLSQLQIDNIATRATYEQLYDFPKPLLVHMRQRGGSYRVVDKLDEDRVYFVNKGGKLQSQPKQEFLLTWSGVAVLVDEETKGIEPDYATNRVRVLLSQVRLPGAVLSFLLLLFYIFFYTDHLNSSFDYWFLLTKAVGVIVTIPLIVRLVDKENAFVNKLCRPTKKTSRADCAGLLDSPDAQLMGVLTWSEIGFLYFTTGFFYLLLFQAHVTTIIAGLAGLAVPYIIYSLYYQWRIARQWCRLCLAVQAVLLIELGIAVAFFRTYLWSPIAWPEVIPLGLTLIVLASIYGYLKPVLIARKRLEKQVPALRKIKYQPEVFHTLLRKSSPIHTNDIVPIELGNPEGKHQITIVSNPECSPCVRAHHQLFELLRKREDISVQEVFLVNEYAHSSDYRIAMDIIRLTLLDDKEQIKAYYQRDIIRDKRKPDYNIIKVDETKARQILMGHVAWCKKKGLSLTPTIFYNGHLFPKEYAIKDLNYFLA